MSTLKFNTPSYAKDNPPGLTLRDRDRRISRDEINYSTKLRFKVFHAKPFREPSPPPAFWTFDNIISGVTVTLSAGISDPGELTVDFGDGSLSAIQDKQQIEHTY
tara:strand:- start:485 stop:799 length:315 start_codon:yes stop_codon:yes gene_type:complete